MAEHYIFIHIALEKSFSKFTIFNNIVLLAMFNKYCQ